jgi:hypothetical protein
MHRLRAALLGWPLAAVLCLVQGGLLAATAWDKSDTADEPSYIAAAALLWSHGDLWSNHYAPLLPKWGFALGLRVAEPQIAQTPPELRQAQRFVLWGRPVDALRRNLFAARMATVLVTVLAGLFLRAAALRFGALPAVVAHVLWCFSPTVLANGSLATLDAWTAGMLCAVAWVGARYLDAPSPGRAALLGVPLGLAAACKLTALGIVPVAAVAGAVALARARGATGQPWRAEWLASVALAAAVAVQTLWCVYLFSTGPLSTRHVSQLYGWPIFTLPRAPFPEWLDGIFIQWKWNPTGRRNYLFGEMGKSGWWWFYLACLALKTTLGAQLLAALRVTSLLKKPPSRRAWEIDALLLAYPVLLVVMMSLGHTQAGIRYILPVFPFGILWLCRAPEDAAAAFGRAGRLVAGLALAAGVAAALRVHPHHLMFFNLWAGGPSGGHRYLIHGDDWGQDVRRLAEWQKQNGVGTLYYTYFTGDPRAWGVDYRKPSCTPRKGVYALQAIEVHRPKNRDPGCLDWLTLEPPDEVLGHTIYIYWVPKERVDRLKAAAGTRTPFWRSGQTAEAAPVETTEPEERDPEPDDEPG